MKNLKLILPILIVILYLSGIGNAIPYFDVFLPTVWISSTLFSIYKTKKYSKKIPETEIRLRNKNDSYTEIAPFILATIGIIFSIFGFLISNNEDKPTCVTYFILCLVTAWEAIIKLPSVKVYYENGSIKFINGKVTKVIETSSVISFNVKKEEILFTSKDQSICIFDHLELNDNEIEKSKIFLNRYIL